MMNTRGNTFAREHVTYTDKQPAFWRFSMDEFILGDLPDTLRYVLKTTGQTSVCMHDEFALARPSLNNKLFDQTKL